MAKTDIVEIESGQDGSFTVTDEYGRKTRFPLSSVKLEGIEEGATADQTGAEIVTLLEALAAGSRLDHGAGLTGLTGDDHTQYLLATGTRALSGAWDMGSQNLTNVNIDGGTMSGITLDGAITGGNQNLNNIGHIGLGDQPSQTRIGIYYEEIYALADNNARYGTFSSVFAYKTSAAYTSLLEGGHYEAVITNSNTQNWTNTVGLRGLYGVVQTAPSPAAAATVTGAASLIADAVIQGGASDTIITNYYGLYIIPRTLIGNSRLTNDYGIYVGDQAGGATLNYAIYTNAGLVRLGGAVTLASTLDLGGKLTGGANEIEGSNFDINGGTIDGVTITSPNLNEAVALTATATELNLLDLAGLTTGELLVATGAAGAAWQSTGVKLSAPDISGTVSAASALTMPTFTAGGDIIGQATYDLGSAASPFAEAYIGNATDYLKVVIVGNIPTLYGMGAYTRIGDRGVSSRLTSPNEDDLFVSRSLEVGYEAHIEGQLTTYGSYVTYGSQFVLNYNGCTFDGKNTDNNYFVIRVRENTVGRAEVARGQGAVDPWFGLGDNGGGLKVTHGNLVGFFGATPVAQQVGVAVTAAGIHAALVNLGLITA